MKKIEKIGSWSIEQDGTMVHERTNYYIEGARLDNENWLVHMAAKRWVDMREFTQAYFTACRVRGIKNLTVRADYSF